MVERGASGCSWPFRVRPGVFVRCGSRVRSACESCAELYRGDWAAIARSGIFDGPVDQFSFYMVTLTAPSFGRVHRVPRSDDDEKPKRCRCGVVHTVEDAALRGAPLDPERYDYLGQVAWNRDSGLLWDRTRRRLRDRWASVEFFIVREWQDRGVLHTHALVRIARSEAPLPEQLEVAARTAVAFSKIDGAVVEWGEQSRCDRLRVSTEAARTVWYMSKALNYVLKDVAREAGASPAFDHLVRLHAAARAIRCSDDCVPPDCPSRVHQRVGARSHVVSASRRTKTRTGWSFTGLTRKLQRQLRVEWMEAQRSESSSAVVAVVPDPAPHSPGRDLVSTEMSVDEGRIV